MQVKTYDLGAAVAELGERWVELVRREGLNPSLDPRWLDITIRSLNTRGSVTVVAMFERDELLGIFPFQCFSQRYYGVRLNVAAPCSNLMSYHAEICAREAHEALLLAVLERAHRGRWDVLSFQNVPEESRTARAIEAIARTRGLWLVREPGERSPYINVRGSWDEFLRTRAKKLRANVTRAIRRMEQCGETGMCWHVSGSTAELQSSILEIDDRSWKKDTGTAIRDSAAEARYHSELLPMLERMGALFANVLFVKHQPGAYVLCCRYNGWVGQLKTSFDRSLPDAGARVIDESIRRAVTEGARTYDFLGDVAPHKLKWADAITSHSSFWLFAGRPLARAIGAAKIASSRIRARVRAE